MDGGAENLYNPAMPSAEREETGAPLLRLPEVGRGLHRLSIASPAARERIEAAFRRLHRDALGGLRPLAEELALNALEEVLLVAAGEVSQDGRMPFDPRVQTVLE